MSVAGSDVLVTRSGRFRGQLPSWLSTVVPLGLLALFLLWAVRADMSFVHTVLAVVAIVITQVLPGMLVWRALRPRDGWVLEDLAIGFAIGSVLAIGAQIPAGLLGWHWFSGAVCVGVAVVLIAVPASRARILEARTLPLPWWWGGTAAVWALYAVWGLRGFFRTNLLSWQGHGFHANYVDMNLHMALAAQMLERGPTRFPWVESEPLGYHYLSHAWVAQVAATSGAGIDEILLRFMPLLYPVVIAVTVAVVALRVTGVLWAGPVAAFLTFAVGGANSLGALTAQSPLTPHSPSVAPSVGMLLALVLVIVLRWRRQLPAASVVLVFLLALGAAGTKGSTTPLVVAGTALALLAMLIFDRSRARAVVPDLIAVAAGLAVAVKVVFRDSEAGLHLSLRDSAAQTWVAGRLAPVDSVPLELAASAVAVLAAITAGALVLGFLVVPELRRRPDLWLIAGAGVAGAGAIGVFAHPGLSQNYFAMSAKPLLAISSAAVLVELVRRSRGRDLLLFGVVAASAGLLFRYGVPALIGGDHGHHAALSRAAAGALLVLLAGVVTAFLVRSERVLLAVAAPCAALMVSGLAVNASVAVFDPTPLPDGSRMVSSRSSLAESMDEIRAARWIRDHSNRDDLVMTNRHCTRRRADPTVGCDSRWFLVAAYSQCQVLVEGWTATPRSAAEGPHGRDSITVPYWHPDLLRLNDDFIASPTQLGADALRRLGVKWIFADRTRPRSDAIGKYATLRFHNRDVNVYEFGK